MPYEIDGTDHINIFSRGATELGRLLSNFAHTPFTGINLRFESVEGWWYWYCTGKKYPQLASLHGIAAKKEGKKYERVKTPDKETLFMVYRRKIECNDDLGKMLVASTLPFTHYYKFGDKVVQTEWEWTGSLWNEVRDYFRRNPI